MTTSRILGKAARHSILPLTLPYVLLMQTVRKCSECWSPVVAYKAATCVLYDTIPAKCDSELQGRLIKKNEPCFGANDGSLTAMAKGEFRPIPIHGSPETPPYLWKILAEDRTRSCERRAGTEISLEAEIESPEALALRVLQLLQAVREAMVRFPIGNGRNRPLPVSLE